LKKNLHRAVFDIPPHSILAVDRELKVVMCNRRCANLLLKSVGEIEGKNLSQLLPHRDLQNQAALVLQNPQTGMKSLELHLHQERDASKILRATITAPPVEDVRNPLCFITLEDVTEHVQLEEQLLQSEKLAGMGLLARSVAHEVGNPLSIMASTLQYIQNTLAPNGNEELSEAIETITDNIHQIHILLRSLSDFSGSKRPKFEFYSLQRILSRLLTFINREAKIRNIKICQEFDEGIPDCQVDHQEIRQLFLNLLKNAIEAMSQGGELRVKMHLALKDSPANQGRVLVEISDTGVGIEETEMQYIFRPLYSTKPKSMGLGLSFCRRVVEEHGGEISTKSQAGKGASFIVSLPIRQRKGGQA